MKTSGLFVLICFALFSSCAPRPGSGVPKSGSVPAPRESSAALGEIPRRIVSLSPAVTEILFAIGAGDRVVGVTQYCDYPPEAQTRTSVGGFSGAAVSVGQIRALDCDLVILSLDMHGRIVSLLDELGIPSVAVEPRNFSQVYDVIAGLGELTGCGSGAEKIIAEMKEKIAGVEERIRGRARPEVFWILGEEPLMSVGTGTFVSEAISLGGGRNIFSDVEEQWPLVSPEQVYLRKPDWVLTADMSRGASPGNPLLRNIPAVREGRMAYLDGDTLYRYGPRLADAVAAIAEILHPGL